MAPTTDVDDTMAELDKFNEELNALADFDLSDLGSDGGDTPSPKSSSGKEESHSTFKVPAAVGDNTSDADQDALMGDSALEDFGDFLDSLTAAGKDDDDE